MNGNASSDDKTPATNKLAKIGVARISHGPGPYVRAANLLLQCPNQGSLAPFGGGIGPHLGHGDGAEQ